jgi:hypothetical protein
MLIVRTICAPTAEALRAWIDGGPAERPGREPVRSTTTYEASPADIADPADRRALKGRVFFDGTVDPPRITGRIEFGPDAFKPRITEPDPDGGTETDSGPDAKISLGGGKAVPS